MTVIMSNSASEAEQLAFTLGEKVRLCTNLREVRKVVDQDQSTKLVVVGSDLPMSAIRELMEVYRITRPSLGIILIRRRIDVATMNEAIQLGVREVVGTDDSEGFIAACRRSIEISQKLQISNNPNNLPSAHAGKTILVFSAKGGCGKTTLSVNLAQALALDPDTSVCIVDFDLQFGDVAVALQVEPTKNISNILNVNNIDQLSLKSVLQSRDSNFDLLLAPNNPADVERINSALAAAVINNLKLMYDYIVIDSPPAFTDVILKSFDLADAYLLLTTLDMPAIKNLRVSLQTLQALGLPEEFGFIILNRSNSKAGLTAEDVESAIERKIFAKIPDSIDVPATTNRGLTIVKRHPRHKVSKEIYRVACEMRTFTNGKSLPAKRKLFSRKSK
jgi:pilus assembly protein CpaE